MQVILYEDELADNGVSLLTVKVVSFFSFYLFLLTACSFFGTQSGTELTHMFED